MRPRYYFIIAFIVVSVLSGCAAIKERVVVYKPTAFAEKEVGLTTIDKNTVWEGRVHVTGDVLVKEGATLTVMPGTVVRFDTIAPKLDKDGGRNMFSTDSPYFPSAEIIVKGRIYAVGTADEPITFTSADKAARPGSWGAISLLGSNGNIIEFCRIYYAYDGVHNHGSTAVVINNVFSHNGAAISFQRGEYKHPAWMFIEHNTMVGNLSGVSARNSITNISFNDISNNKFFGIWLHEGVDARVTYNDITQNGKGIYLYMAEPLKIRFNNIYDNEEYNVAMAESTPNNLDARENWWGTLDAAIIKSKIYDKASDPSLGKVIFEPVLDHRVTGIVK